MVMAKSTRLPGVEYYNRDKEPIVSTQTWGGQILRLTIVGTRLIRRTIDRPVIFDILCLKFGGRRSERHKFSNSVVSKVRN